MPYLLLYDLADDVGRRAAVRAEHLALVREAAARGELACAGTVAATADAPGDGVILLFTGDSPAAAEAFAAADPYVRHGLVTGWRVRPWTPVLPDVPAAAPTSAPPLPVARDAAAHYAWGDGCDGWHLVRASGLAVIEERMPAGTREVRHRHARARQFFYVLRGRLTIEVERRVHALGPGAGLEVPPGAAHEVRNDGDGPAEFLVVSQPPGQGDRVAAPAG